MDAGLTAEFGEHRHANPDDAPEPEVIVTTVGADSRAHRLAGGLDGGEGAGGFFRGELHD